MPSIVDNLDISRQTQSTTTVQRSTTVTVNINSASTDTSHGPRVYPVTTTESAASTTNKAAVFRRRNSSGTDGVFTYTSTSNASSNEWRPGTDVDDYYYTVTNETEATDRDIQQTSFLTNNNETDAAEDRTHEEVNDEGRWPQQLFTTDAVLNVSGSEEIDNSSLSAVSDDSSAVDHSQSQTWMFRPSTTSTASPLSTTWLLAELPSESHWVNEVHGPDEYVTAHHRDLPSSHGTFPLRLGLNWRLLQRQSRPSRRRTTYRQMLASPFVAGGGAMTERKRKRALLHAFLLSKVAGKDLSLRRAMSASVFYRPKQPATPDKTSKQTEDPESSAWNSETVDTTESQQRSDLAVTESLDNSSSTWNPDTSTLLSYGAADNWTSVDNATTNDTSVEGLVSAAQYHQTSSGRAAAAAVVIPIIVGFLESLTRKQFSWLDLTLAVCGTAAAVLGLINLVVFVVHLVRSKRGKLSFPAERPLVGGHAASSSPSSTSRSSSDSTPPPPPPPPPPLPLTGFGGVSWSNREVSRDVLADDETMRIRPLTFKRPLTDWGFASTGHGTTEEAVVVAGQSDGVTVKSTGSDASSSGVESAGGRSDGGSSRRARGHDVNVPIRGNSVITNYAYCGNAAAGVNNGLVIDVDEYRDRSCTSPADFVFGKNYGQRYY